MAVKKKAPLYFGQGSNIYLYTIQYSKTLWSKSIWATEYELDFFDIGV